MIKHIQEIDSDVELGKLLLAAVAKITTESQTDKTPDQVLEQISILKSKMEFQPSLSNKKSMLKTLRYKLYKITMDLLNSEIKCNSKYATLKDEYKLVTESIQTITYR